MRICGIDIGLKNFAHFIDEFDETCLKNMKIIDDIYKCGKRISCNVKDLSHNDKDEWNDNTRENLVVYLNSYKHLFETCDKVRVEQQYFSGHTMKNEAMSNVKAIRICECVMMWFKCSLPHVDVKTVPAASKYVNVGMPATQKTKAQRKTWSGENIERIMTLRNDDEFVKFTTLKKDTFKKQVKKWSKDKIDEHLDKFIEGEIKEIARSHLCIESQKIDDIGDAFLITHIEKVKLI